MVLQILLLISIVMQIIAVAIALRLMSKTKYNLSWILFTIAFIAMVVVRCAEYIELVWGTQLKVPQYFFIWLGVITSICFAVGLMLIKKIFNWIDALQVQRSLTQKRILNTILQTEEKERLRFSKELHDGLGPLLSSARLSMSALKKEALSDAGREVLENTHYVIQEALSSLREISNNLSPHILTSFGLNRGVTNFINKLPTKDSFKINFSTNLRNQRFDNDVEVILYRIICELINNSIKHSGGDTIELTLNQQGEEITLLYSDNGRGYNIDEISDSGGMGISNIKSRISSLKGELSFNNSEGKGTETKIVITLDSRDDR